MYPCKAEFEMVTEEGHKGKIIIEGEYPVFVECFDALQNNYKTKYSIQRAYRTEPEETEEDDA